MTAVLFISPTGDFANGAERSAYQLMRYLSGEGYTVFNAYPAHFPSIEPVYRTAMEKAGIRAICVPNLRWWPDSPIGDVTIPADSPADVQAVDELAKIIRENNINTVITNTVNIYHGAIAAKKARVKHIWLIHEFPLNEFAYYRNKIDFIAKSSDAVFSVAGALNEHLSKLFAPCKLGSFLPYVEYAEACKVSDDNDKHRLICIGLITENKNQLELLEAYALLPKELRNNLEVVFIGSHMGEYKTACDAFIERMNLAQVAFFGFCDHPWSQVGTKDIVILPSKSETFGCVYAEAAMNATPVIASNCSGHIASHELFNTGSIYPLGDAKALASAIEYAVYNFEQVKQAAIEAAPAARRVFSAEHAYSELLAEIARRDRPRRKWACSLKRAKELSCSRTV